MNLITQITEVTDMTNEMILRYIKERRFLELAEEGQMTAWVVTWAFIHGYMNEKEMLSWSEYVLGV